MSVISTVTKLLVTTLDSSGTVGYSVDNFYLDMQNSDYYSAAEKKSTTDSRLFIKSENSDFKKLEGELYSYLDLDENWDGYDGIIPNKKIIDTCQEIIEKLKKSGINAPQPMLTGSGEIGLYWRDTTTYIELSFEEEDSFSYIIDNDGLIVGEEDYSKYENLPIKLLAALDKIKKQKSSISTYNVNSLSTMYIN